MELRVADNPDKSRYEITADGEVAFRQHKGGHTPGPWQQDWQFIVAADRAVASTVAPSFLASWIPADDTPLPAA